MTVLYTVLAFIGAVTVASLFFLLAQWLADRRFQGTRTYHTFDFERKARPENRGYPQHIHHPSGDYFYWDAEDDDS